MKKLLIVPDIHQAHNLDAVEAAILREAPDRTIFLGDYFDQWHDKPEHAERTAKWLRESLAQPNRVHLWGNHDLSYGFPYRENAICSGFSLEKLQCIRDVLSADDWERLRLTHWEGDILFSHAGWTRDLSLTPRSAAPLPVGMQRAFLEAQEREAWRALRDDRHHWVWGAGPARGGDRRTPGGLVWCDQGEFTPIPGVHQIFGHTPGNLATVIRDDCSCNLCLDTTNRFDGVRHYLTVEPKIKILVKEITGQVVRELHFEDPT